MKYIGAATQRMKSGSRTTNGEPSLLEKVITSEKNEKIATIMALDLILVGIDTVSRIVLHSNGVSRRAFVFSDKYGRLLHSVPTSHPSRIAA